MSNGVVYLAIPGVGAVIGIWYNVYFKISVLIDGQVIRKEFFSESSHRIERHLDVVIEILEIQSSVSFELYLDEELIESWRADIMFEGSTIKRINLQKYW